MGRAGGTDPLKGRIVASWAIFALALGAVLAVVQLVSEAEIRFFGLPGSGPSSTAVLGRKDQGQLEDSCGASCRLAFGRAAEIPREKRSRCLYYVVFLLRAYDVHPDLFPGERPSRRRTRSACRMAEGRERCLGGRRGALRVRADEQLPPPRVRVRLI